MAFEIQNEKKKLDFMPIVIGLFVVVFVGAAVYYMFFAESPFINTIVNTSSELERSASELERVRSSSSPNTILNDQTFKDLRAQTTPLSTSSTGRSNPFQPF